MDLGRFLQIRMDLSRFALHFDLSGCWQDLCDFVGFVWIWADLSGFRWTLLGLRGFERVLIDLDGFERFCSI